MQEFNFDALTILRFPQGSTMTNAYLMGEAEEGMAVVVDPAWDGLELAREADRRGWRITNIWLTHAHFDHFAGAAALDEASQLPIPVALHPDDHPLWRVQGGAPFFNLPEFDPGPEPTIGLADGMTLRLGQHTFTVRHTPGHTPGHVTILAEGFGCAFVGDLVFQGSVGRTDFPGSSREDLIESIQTHILTLPDETLLLPGHGPVTTVGQERAHNPFLV